MLLIVLVSPVVARSGTASFREPPARCAGTGLKDLISLPGTRGDHQRRPAPEESPVQRGLGVQELQWANRSWSRLKTTCPSSWASGAPGQWWMP